MTPVALLSEVAATMKKLGATAQPGWRRKHLREPLLFAHDAAGTLTKEIGWVFNLVQGIYDWKERQWLRLWNLAAISLMEHKMSM